MNTKELQKKYPEFVYEKYSYRISKNNLEVLFDFSLCNFDNNKNVSINFQPKTIIKNINKKRLAEVGEGELENLVFNLGIMEMISYWKAACSPKIVINAGYLNPEQVKWWQDLIINGMGQFFYENKIPFQKPSFIIANTDKEKIIREKLPNEARPPKGVLAPVGGGKDSIVTLELLKAGRIDFACFAVNPTGAAQKTIKLAGYNNPIIVERNIDKKLLKLNREGFLNGHTPFSAYLAFLSVFAAVLFNKKYIALSNERSSNEGNVKYLGKIINHQWSKSFDFEEKFRKYAKKYLTPEVDYFSFLRPLYEIQITKLFSQYPRYFDAFLSCNEAHKTDSGKRKPSKKWCGKCSKCLFVFAVLYPFIDEKKLINIFGKNLFTDKTLLPIMQELIGERGFKPFECVGTAKEALVAFYLSWKKHRENYSARRWFLMEYFEKKVLFKHPSLAREAKKIMNSWNNRNNLPEEFKKQILTKIR